MKNNQEIEKSILLFLYKNNYIGKKNTPKENVCHKLNVYSCKDVNKSLNNLYKKEYVGIHLTNHGPDVYLAHSKIMEI
jgi:hypothetical protein